ncbi:hypothetical protein WKY_04853, partial [Escherichia coli KTE180]
MLCSKGTIALSLCCDYLITV